MSTEKQLDCPFRPENREKFQGLKFQIVMRKNEQKPFFLA